MAALAESVGLDSFSLTGLSMPVTIHLPKALSDEELLAFSSRNRPFRIERNENGDLEIMSPLGLDGGRREVFVMAKLFAWAEQYGGVCVSSNAGFKLPTGGVRSPDASWTSEARLSRLTDAERRGFAPVCPDFLVEILSETDRPSMLEAKMEMWMANGAQLAWMIDPFQATLTIYRPGETPRLLLRPDWVEADVVVPGFRLETLRLWET